MRNLLSSFEASVARWRHRPCFRFYQGRRWRSLSWIEVRERVRGLALGLKALGVRKGDRVALLSGTRHEWTLCDLAVLSLGAVTVPIYPSSTPDQIAYILRNSGARAIFLEDLGQLRKIQAIRVRVKTVRSWVLFEGTPPRGVLDLVSLTDLGREGDEESWELGYRGISPEDVATIVYTSGTTGEPKGAVITHRNFLKEVEVFRESFDLDERHTALFFLPTAHIFARAVQFWQLSSGFVQAYARSLGAVADDLRTIRPHFIASVPRIFEKFQEKTLASLHAASRFRKILLKAAPFLLSRRVRAIFGGRLRFAVSGGAPLAKDLAEFFDSHGVRILEGYGLTETTAGIFINTARNHRFGTVGRAVRGTRVKIAGDGEILIKSPMVFRGYYRDPRATRAAFTRDGWFKTGDIGVIDRDGYLKITDRKKDIIITAAGKNIAPQNVENVIRASPYVSHALVYGDRQKYLTALVTLNREAVERWMRRNRFHGNGHRGPGRHPEVQRLIRREIEGRNKRLASYETVKRFRILDGDFTQDGGELTPTLKLKRKFVVEKYRDVLNDLYTQP